MLVYKINVLEAIKEAGYTTTRIRRERIISEGSLTRIRAGKMVSIETLEVICRILDMQPGNIIKYVEDEE